MQPFIYEVRIRGEYACFTRPEFKTERVSYEVITPSAARGVLEAVYGNPPSAGISAAFSCSSGRVSSSSSATR